MQSHPPNPSRLRVFASSRLPKRRHRRKPLLAGSGLVKIYAGRTKFRAKGKLRRYQTHLLVYHDAAGRHRERRASLDDAKARADQIGRDILNGQAAMAQFSEADRAAYAAALENCKRAGLDLVTGTAQLAALAERLQNCKFSDANLQPPSLEALADFWLANRPRAFTQTTLPALVELFLAEKKDGSPDYHAHIGKQLERFTDHFAPDPKAAPSLHLLDGPGINAWLRGLKGPSGAPLGLRTRHNYRAAVDSLCRWALANGYLPKDWSAMAHVADPGAKTGETKILSPDQLTRLLHARHQAELAKRAKGVLVPFIALQSFAGIRHEEMNGHKALLDWRNIDLDGRVIYVPRNVAKTGNDRLVPITDNLAAWLADYKKTSGPVVDLVETANAITAGKRAAGIPAGKNETRNVLRKSFISYRLALVGDIARVAGEAGNSPAMIRKHYLRFCQMPGVTAKNPFAAEAQRWFGIWPDSADIIQLSLALK